MSDSKIVEDSQSRSLHDASSKDIYNSLGHTPDMISEDSSHDIKASNENGKNKLPKDNAKKQRTKSVAKKASPSKIKAAYSREEITLAYGAKYILKIFAPATVCIVIVVATVRSVPFYTDKNLYLVDMPFDDKDEDITAQLGQSFAKAGGFLFVLIFMAFILVFLYKYRFYKVIRSVLVISSVMVLFLISSLHFEQILVSYNVPLDYFTLVIIAWNFGATGIVCIHWKGPLLLQQTYLVVTSALISLAFIEFFSELTVWTVLCMMIVWDLIAVLCPKGPLKMLIELAQDRNEPIFPALIYSSTILWQITMAGINDTDQSLINVPKKQVTAESLSKNVVEEDSSQMLFPMSANRERIQSESMQGLFSANVSDLEIATAKEPSTKKQRMSEEKMNNKDIKSTVDNPQLKMTDLKNELKKADSSVTAKEKYKIKFKRQSTLVNWKCEDRQSFGTCVDPPKSTEVKKSSHVKSFSKRRSINKTNRLNLEEQYEEGIKIGLGDFIFYGVLVGKASLRGDWNIIIACYFAILVGLSCTLLMLVICQKALPALPISLGLGILFYIFTSTFVQAFTGRLSNQQVYI